MDPAVRQQTSTALGVLSRVQKLFGAGTPPSPPPAFVTPADLEADLGAGRF